MIYLGSAMLGLAVFVGGILVRLCTIRDESSPSGRWKQSRMGCERLSGIIPHFPPWVLYLVGHRRISRLIWRKHEQWDCRDGVSF